MKKKHLPIFYTLATTLLFTFVLGGPATYAKDSSSTTTVTKATALTPEENMAKKMERMEARMEKREARMAKKLGLTDEQIKAMKTIREKYKPSTDEMNQMHQLHKELRTAMQSSNRGEAYQKELLEKFKKIEKLRSEKGLKHFQMALEMREILTDEQLKKFHQSRMEHRGEKTKFGCDRDNGEKRKGKRGKMHPSFEDDMVPPDHGPQDDFMME